VRAYWAQWERPDRERVAVRIARERRARGAVDQQRDQDRRKGQLDISHPHDEGVQPSARVTREQPQTHAEHHRQHHRGHAHQQRDARAVEDRRQHISALIVGAEQVRQPAVGEPGRGQQRIVQRQRGQIEGTVRRDPRRENRAEDHHHRDQGCPDRDRTGTEAVPEVAIEEAGEGAVHFLAAAALPAALPAPVSITTYLNGLKLSASCTRLTFFFMPQASAC